MKNAAFTIIAQNYVGYAITLAESMKNSNPDINFYIYFADGINDEIKKLLSEKKINYVDSTQTRDNKIFLEMAFKYEVTEYCTSIKPFIINQLFDENYETVTYIDPDIYVYGNLYDSVLNSLYQGSSIVLTPHICSPITDNRLPDEQIHLKSGTYNLGFVSIKNSKIGRSIATWWSEKCQHTCYNDSVSGLFVDQKWTNLIPGMFEGVYISRNLGLNMAYWNLHERRLDNDLVNGKESLIFFHFSGFIVNDINSISKYQNRFTLELRSDLYALFSDYREKVLSVISVLDDLPKYKYNNYSNGLHISLLARRCFAICSNQFESPFANQQAEKIFLEFLKKNNIKEEAINNSISIPNEINNKARKINFLMRTIQRLLGPNKYVSLCKYFAFLSSIHQQRFMLNEYKKSDVISDNRAHLKR